MSDLMCPFCGSKRLSGPEPMTIKDENATTIYHDKLVFSCDDCERDFIITGTIKSTKIIG